MQEFFASLVKLTVIFAGGGIASLFAYWIFEQISTIPELIYEHEKKSKKGIRVLERKKIIKDSGLYEIFLPQGEKMKLFSSQKGMKLV
ncbi:MAG: hypothetical protein A3B68_08325 [Candidatus Melainabacteria bacterium RIFCSPHIGHO2_02_FULL_34_12]|nr:MAG: hypothetical protein A3B68_08325 [Candidatus Melainabacteria bacterium RIFCSPHIGHO2_02_FULL_34_12]